MSQPRDDRQDDLFQPPLEKIINLRHPLVRLAREIDWGFLAGRFRSVCRVGPGQPPLPTRLVAGLFILKHMHNLSDEALCDRWVENPYFQYFCGEVVFRHELPFDRSSLTRWRQRLGEEQLVALFPQALVVSTPAAPTGSVFNSSTSFPIAEGGVSRPAVFLFATKSGEIAGWNPCVNPTSTVTAFKAPDGAIYTGLARATANGADVLYAADFHNGKIDVLSSAWVKTTLSPWSLHRSQPTS